MPLLGRLSDRFGRRLVLQASLAGFAIRSVVTAPSNDLTMMVIGRVIRTASAPSAGHAVLAVDLAAARGPRQGSAQPELGSSVLGPLLRHRHRAGSGPPRRMFWINVPLTILAW